MTLFVEDNLQSVKGVERGQMVAIGALQTTIGGRVYPPDEGFFEYNFGTFLLPQRSYLSAMILSAMAAPTCRTSSMSRSV